MKDTPALDMLFKDRDYLRRTGEREFGFADLHAYYVADQCAYRFVAEKYGHTKADTISDESLMRTQDPHGVVFMTLRQLQNELDRMRELEVEQERLDQQLREAERRRKATEPIIITDEMRATFRGESITAEQARKLSEKLKDTYHEAQKVDPWPKTAVLSQGSRTVSATGGNMGTTIKGGLKSAIKSAKERESLLVVPRLDKYLIESRQNDRAFSDATRERIHELLGSGDRDRAGSFSPSALHKCTRRQMYGFLGVPQPRSSDSRLLNLFMDGQWRHLRLQAVMLEAGIVDEVEVPLADPDTRLRGTADAKGESRVPSTKVKGMGVTKPFLVEIKGYYERQFDIVVNTGEPKDKHVIQAAGYSLLSGIDICAIVYECKGTQRLKEFDIDFSKGDARNLRRDAENRLDALNSYVDREVLPDQLDEFPKGECEDCPYLGICPDVNTWAKAKAKGRKRKVRKVRKPSPDVNGETEAREVPVDKLPTRLVGRQPWRGE